MFAHELKGTQIFMAQAWESEYKMSIWLVMHWLQQVYCKSESSMGDHTGKFFSTAVGPDSSSAQNPCPCTVWWVSAHSAVLLSFLCPITLLKSSELGQKSKAIYKIKRLIIGWALITFLSLQQPIDVNEHLRIHIYETTAFQACCGIVGMYRMYIIFLFQKSSRPGHFIFSFI